MDTVLSRSLETTTSFHPILRMESGAPSLPHGTIGSISHKNNIAVGIASKFMTTLTCKFRHLGVDIEHIGSMRHEGIARRILTGSHPYQK